MYEQPERSGVSGTVAALLAIIALVFGLLSGVLLGGAGGYLLARFDVEDGPSRAAADDESLRGRILERADDRADDRADGRAATVAGQEDPGEEGATEGRAGREKAQADAERGERAAGADSAEAEPGEAGAGAPQEELRPFLGVRVQTAGLEVGEFSPQGGEGALVVSVDPDTPAEEAGLQAGDVIVAVDDSEIATADDLVNTISEYAVGDTVTLKVLRDESEIELEAELVGRSAAEIKLPMDALPGMRMMPFDPDDPDFQQFLDQLPPGMRERMEQMLEDVEDGELFEGLEPLPPPDVFLEPAPDAERGLS